MKISQIRTKLKLFCKIFITSPKKWNNPRNTDVLIYDLVGSEYLMPYLEKYSVSTMALRGESINAFCLLSAMLKLSFWKGRPIKAYVEAYIQAVLPLVIITFIDTDINFYSISKIFPKSKTILVQNGTRGNWLDAFSGKYKFHVDYMLVHGVSIGMYYSAHISGEVLPIGSIRNNAASSSNKTISDSVLFISQWVNPKKSDEFNDVDFDGNLFSWNEYFKAELIVLKFLDKWCFENNKKLKVCGREIDAEISEKSFYTNHLDQCEWLYIPKKDNYNPYKLIDNAEIVVHIDSTLGYEAIARNKKTATFSCRSVAIFGKGKTISWPFGWPGDLPNNGPFWTNDLDIEQFQRIMDYISTISYKDWEQSQSQYSNDLLEFDSGNTCLVSLLNKLLPTTERKSYVN